MSIIKLGMEIIETVRVRRLLELHGEQFLKKVFTDREIAFCQSRKRAAEHFASCWAAKLATRKCLGQLAVKRFAWTEIELAAQPDGERVLRLRGATRDRAKSLQVAHWSVAVTHGRTYAAATVVATRAEA